MHEKLVEFQHRSNHPVTASVGFAKVPNAEVLQRLSCPSLDTGLSSEAVKELTEKFGLNELKSGEEESKILKFLGQFYESPLNLLLFGSAGVSALLGNYDDAVSISLAIVIVVTVGFVQEQRSEKSLEALNQLVPHHCRILRDRTWRTDTATVLVPGDVVHLSTGDRVPADVRLLEASDLEIDESNLTGETRPALKTSDAILSSNVSDISERTNIAFMGTLVKAGRGKGVVVSTGDKTEFGVIFSMMQEIQDRKTPLQDNMDNLAQKLSAASFAIIGVICLIGVYQKRSWLEMFTIGGKPCFPDYLNAAAPPATDVSHLCRRSFQCPWLWPPFLKVCPSWSQSHWRLVCCACRSVKPSLRSCPRWRHWAPSR